MSTNRHYYAAPCWSEVPGSADRERDQFTILLFGSEYPLEDGLVKMRRECWTLVHVQRNDAGHHKLFNNFCSPDSFYIFLNCPELKQPET